MYDLIGDIHGHADELTEILSKLGYVLHDGSYSHPTRKVIFVGDYIDRGPKIRETLQIVKAMVDNGSAIALMGNHEYNALCFFHENTTGGHLREHSIKNIVQHFETLKQFQNRQEEYEMYTDWLISLPLFFETDDFRVVHACWDENHIAYLRTILTKQNTLTLEILSRSLAKGTQLYIAIDETLKGKEVWMPDGLSFIDKDGTHREEIRIKWWQDPAKETYRSISVAPIESLPETPFDCSLLDDLGYYTADKKPVFFGHYWLDGTPMLYNDNICCLDYSVAKKGYLVAYRWDGEEKLDNSKFLWV